MIKKRKIPKKIDDPYPGFMIKIRIKLSLVKNVFKKFYKLSTTVLLSSTDRKKRKPLGTLVTKLLT